MISRLTSAGQQAAGRTPDRSETDSGYHAAPEDHLKSSQAGEITERQQVSSGARPSEEMEKPLLHFGSASSAKGELMVDLDHVKVTPRDQQVLNLLVQGCSNKEIAGQLKISPRTVKQHLRTLFLRAGIREGRKRVKLATAVFAREGQLS